MPYPTHPLRAVPLALGCAAGVMSVESFGISLIIPAALCLIALAAVFYLPYRRVGLLLAAGLLCGFGSAIIQTPAHSIHYGEEATIYGHIQSVRTGTAGQYGIVIADSIDGAPSGTKLRIIVTDLSPRLMPGDVLRFTAPIEPAGKYEDIPGLFALSASDKADAISASAIVEDTDLEIVGSNNDIQSTMARLRQRITEACHTAPLTSSAASLLVSGTLGGDNIDIENRNRFRAVGVAHLLCVSGFHVALISSVLWCLLLPLSVWSRGGRVRYILMVALVWFYACIVGLSPSVLRAAIMISVYFLCRLLERRQHPANALALACFIILVLKPSSLYSVGFQLSVCAVASILVFAQKFNPVPRRIQGLRVFVDLLAVPLAAMIGTAPVVLAWFHSIPLFSVPANAIMLYLFPIFLLTGAVTVLLHTVGLPASVPGQITDWLASTMESVCDGAIDIFGQAPHYFLLPTGAALLAAVIISFAAILHTSNPRHKACAGALTLLLGIFTACHNSAETSPALLCTASRYTSEIIVANGEHSQVFSSARKISKEAETFLLSHGVSKNVEPAKLRGEKHLLTVDNLRILIADNHLTDSMLCKVDIVLFEGMCKLSPEQIIAASKPSMILIGAQVPKTQTDMLYKSSIPVQRLAEKPYNTQLIHIDIQ